MRLKLREDGAAIEVGENDNLIIEKLAADSEMFGVFGYSFFDQNRDKVQASLLDGVELNLTTLPRIDNRVLARYSSTLKSRMSGLFLALKNS